MWNGSTSEDGVAFYTSHIKSALFILFLGIGLIYNTYM